MSWPPEISFHTVLFGSRSSRAWSTYASCTVSPSRSSPASGASSPAIIRNSVVLPAPFGPITPTIPAGGSENSRFSNSRRSPKPFATPVASITRSPSRGPGGMWISTRSSLTASSSASSRSYAPRRAFDFACRAFGASRTHSSSRCSVRWRAELCFSSVREPRLLLLEPAGVVPLVRDAAAAVELEDPAGDVVEEVPVVRDRDDGSLVVGEEPLEPEHRLRVQVVRRLVEQQQVGRREQQPAERDAPPLAARERRHVAVAFGHAQRVHRVVELCVELPGVAPVDLVLDGGLLGEQRVEVGVGLGELRRDRVEPVEEVAQLAHSVLDVLAHRLRGVEVRLLFEQPDGRPGRELGDAGRRLLLAGHDPRAASTCRSRSARARRSSRPAGTRARCSRAPAGRTP